MMRLLLAGAVVSLSVVSQVSAEPVSRPLFVIHHTVADYAKWRPGYDAHKSVRDAAGLTNCEVRSAADNPNEVFIACEMASLAKAKAFTTSKSLADAMRKSGVVGKPVFYFLSPAR
jgi:hypothetical protein